MDMETIAQSLSFLGITQSQSEGEDPIWSIEIASDEDESRPRSAYFDRDLRQWRLEDPAIHKSTTPLSSIEEEAQRREIHLMTELSDIERRASRLANIVPTGICESAADGTLRWANSQFYNILGVPQERRNIFDFDWKDYIHPDDQPRAGQRVRTCGTHGVEASDTLRLKKHYDPPQKNHDPTFVQETSWVLYATSPDLKDDGTVGGLLGALSDISHLKWSEQHHIRSAENARRDKERQEEFIDITSHGT